MSETEHTEKKQSDRWFTIFCGVMIVLLLINTFVIKLALVNGRSMYPTLQDNQLMLVFRPGYTPAGGDVVVIHTGNGIFNRVFFVMRVFGSQGLCVTFDYVLDTVTVDDTILTEPYLNSEEGDTMLPRDDRSVVHYTVPEGCVFVMGDNRNHSADSRSDKYGMIDTSKIVGRVVLPVLP